MNKLTNSANTNESQISALTSTPDGLNVTFSGDQKTISFSWRWLRDHGCDEASLDPKTFQRRVDTFNIPSDLSPNNVTLEKDQHVIQIEWNDGTSSTVSSKLLAGITGRAALDHQLLGEQQKRLWDQHSPLEDFPTVNYANVMSSDDGLLEWLKNIAIYGFSIVEDVPVSDKATDELAARIGSPQETLFGRMWHLSAELEDHGDTAYTTEFLEPHTDSSYYHDAPGLQMFSCQEFNGKGGESIQVDSFAIAKRMQEEDPEAYVTLCDTIVPGHYLEPGEHVRAERPVFRLNSRDELVQVTFNNYDRAPMLLEAEHEVRFYRAYGVFHKHAMDQRNWLKIPLRPGMTLIFDNWRNMHGRMGYVGKRVFYGCYHSMASFESKLRVLRAPT